MRASTLVVGLLIALQGGVARSGFAQTSPGDANVRKALDAQDRWLASSPRGTAWSQYLWNDELRQQLAVGTPDRAALEQVLARYRSSQPGIDSLQFAAVRRALERWLDRIPINPSELAARIRSAAEHVAAPAPADAAKARTQLEGAVADLDRYLATQGANGTGWRRYLRLDVLRSQLASPQPSLDTLVEVSRQFSSGQFGLQLTPFDQAGKALVNYLQIARRGADPEAPARYKADLNQLATSIEQYAAQPTEETAVEIGNTLGQLASVGVAPLETAAVRSLYARPNFFVRVSDDFVSRAVAESVEESEPVREFIQGTRVRGTARTVGVVSMDLVPNDHQAVLQALFVGTTRTRTVGANGPATIYSAGTTRLNGQQLIVLDPAGIHAGQPIVEGRTSIRTNGIGTSAGGIRGCIVERVATKRIAEAKPSVERTTSRKAEARLKVRLRERVDKQIAEANQRYWQQVRQPLVAKNQFPNPLLIRTTDHELLASGALAGPTQLGAATAPPSIATTSDVGVQLHESAVNNFAQAVLAGETIQSEQARSQLLDMTGKLPDRADDEEAKAPWSITFADQKPIEVRFADGTFTITIRGKQYTSDDRTYRAMNVTAVYKVESSPTGVKAVRQGDLQIFPPGFVPGARRFSVPEQTLRSMLERRFGRIFTTEFGDKPIEPPGRFAKIGPLQLSDLMSSAGWLSVGLKPAQTPLTVVAASK